LALPHHLQQPGERFALEIPPDPAFIGTARLFAASIGRSFRLPETSVDDMKLAVSEACGYLMVTAPGPVAVQVEQSAARLTFNITSTPSPAAEASDHETLLGLEVIGALFPDAQSTPDPPTITFSVPLEKEPPGTG
jgi:hypothetical protein